jgi:hypothetical protein
LFSGPDQSLLISLDQEQIGRPKVGKHQIELTLNDATWAELCRRERENGISRTDTIRRAIDWFFSSGPFTQ